MNVAPEYDIPNRCSTASLVVTCILLLVFCVPIGCSAQRANDRADRAEYRLTVIEKHLNIDVNIPWPPPD